MFFAEPLPEPAAVQPINAKELCSLKTIEAAADQSECQSLLLPNMEQRRQSRKKFEAEILNRIAQERLAANYQQLKQWDHQRSVLLRNHRRTIEQLIGSINDRLTVGQEGVRAVLACLHKRVQAYKQYAGQHIPQPIAPSINAVGAVLYGQANRQLGQIYEETTSVQGSYRSAVVLLSEKLEEADRANYQSSLSLALAKERMERFEDILCRKNEEASSACEFLASLPSNEDLYLTLMAFLECAEQQRLAQAELAKEALKFRELAMAEAQAQNDIIQRVLQEFIRIINSLGNTRKQAATAVPTMELDLLELSYRPQSLLGDQLKTIIKQSLGMKMGDSLFADHLEKYLLKQLLWQFSLSVPKFQPDRIILKRFEAYYRQSEQDFTQVVLVITADKYLHVYARDLVKSDFESRQFGFLLTTAQIKKLSQLEAQISCQPFSAKHPKPLQFSICFVSEPAINAFLTYTSLIVG